MLPFMKVIYNSAGEGVFAIVSDYYCLQYGPWVLPLGATEPC